jgi:CRP-like cAMP-binding protein
MMREFLSGLRIFNQDELDYFVSQFTQKKVKRGEFFIKEGETCKEVAFIETGIYRSYYSDDKGNENTFCFRFPNTFLAPYASFITGKPSYESQQAMTDAILWVASKTEIERFDSSNFLRFLKSIAENEYLDLEDRFFQLQRDSAQERYLSLFKKQPELIRDIPLQYLASYLGITQRHLSRIRSEIRQMS